MSSTKNIEPIDLIYILSNGRSGSTILDMLLGSTDEVWTLGEYLLAEYEWSNERLPCGCGQDFSQCDFWIKLKDDLISKNKEDLFNSNKFRDHLGVGKVLRRKYLSAILTGKVNGNLKAEAKAYGLANYNVLTKIKNEVLKRKKVQYLLDASKDPYRLLLLHLSGYFNIKVIHLTKRVQAFTYSMSKPDFNYFLGLRMSFRWLIENYLMIKIGQHFFPKNSFHHLNYEDMVISPGESFQNMQKKFNIQLTNIQYNNLSKVKSHGIAGNISRFKGENLLLDNSWKKLLPTSLKKLSAFVGYPLKNKLKHSS